MSGLKRLFLKVMVSQSIFRQLVLFVAVVGLVPIIFISAFMYREINSMLMNELIDAHDQLAAQYISSLNGKFYRYNNSLDQIANNTIVLNTLTSSAENMNPYLKGNAVSTEVNKSLNLDTDIELRNCMIYSNVKNNDVYGQRVAMMSGAARESWYVYLI